ncbi:ABC transporter permease subunit [Pacificibacter sp.]|uniref:ABC transporter permease subunit n=1 Tax=Pacificibacter sp. TaxID=1917866 RepID=UPI00321AA08C
MTTTEVLRKKSRQRKITIQVLLVIISIIAIWGAVSSAQVNLAALGITNGFGFLDRSTGWDYSFSLVERSINDPYSKTLVIGFQNTIFVGFISIFFATIFGFIIGTGRDSSHPGVKAAATVFVQTFRNIPLILQGVFLYSVLIHFPGPRQSMSFADSVFLSNRGLMLPGLNVSPSVAVALILAIASVAVLLVWRKVPLLRGLIIWIAAAISMSVIVAFVMRPEGEPLLSIPSLKGLRFNGGITVSIELVAMITAITLYGSAYIAEVVRGGLKQVPRGLIEAGQAVGLTQGQIWHRIKMPMSLRSIIPPLGNQWIFIMKATTIGIAIGFSDMFYIVSNSITQSGQTLELIFLLMAAFLTVNFSISIFTNWLNNRLKLKAH